MACNYVVFDFGNNHSLLPQRKICRVSYDPLFVMGGICRISEFWNLSSQLKICGTQIVQNAGLRTLFTSRSPIACVAKIVHCSDRLLYYRVFSTPYFL